MDHTYSEETLDHLILIWLDESTDGTGCSENIVRLEGWKIFLVSGYSIKARRSEKKLKFQLCPNSTNVHISCTRLMRNKP